MKKIAKLRRSDRTTKEKEKAVLKNGAILLEERIRSCFGRDNPIKIYSASQIEEAIKSYTAQYSQQTDLRGDFRDPWCKGILGDRLVLIKKYTCLDTFGFREENACRDIAVSSMMSSHRNVLKLLGCCLEFPLPALVYEDAESGALNSRGGTGEDGSLPWKKRLKIAKEIASAVAYMHTAFPTPIIHRHIRAVNIFLDQHYSAKLSDFSISISIPEGEIQIEDEIVGTIGFVDPEYLQSRLITEKIDVYSFGMLLLVLLTGKPPIDLTVTEEDRILVRCVERLVEEGKFSKVVDPAIQGNVTAIEPELHPQLHAFLELALSCVKLIPENRPSMTQVAKELLRIERSTTAP